MKTFLVFNKIGEITEQRTKYKTFYIENFKEYKHYKRYDEYIILYNVEDKSRNITVFYFTEDQYTSDIALFKIDSNQNIKNLTYESYVKKIKNIKYEISDDISDEEIEIVDVEPFVYC